MATYNEVINSWSPEDWQVFGAGGGYVDNTGNLVKSVTPQDILSKSGTSAYTEYASSPGMFGINQGKWNNMGQLAGLAGSALNVYDQLWGTSGKLKKEQLGLLKEQRAANQESLANKREFKNMFSNAGKGLAASTTSTSL